MDARPADAARRALREARQQQAPHTESPAAPRRPEPREAPGPEEPTTDTDRPADLAREALRGAVSARRGAGSPSGGSRDTPPKATGDTTDVPPRQHPEHPDEPPGAAAPTGGDPSASSRPAGSRPADAAREALRAALARRDADAEPTRAEPTRTDTTSAEGVPASRAGRSVPGGGRAGAGAREVRELLAGAFRMPRSTATGSGQELGDNHVREQGSRDLREAPAPRSATRATDPSAHVSPDIEVHGHHGPAPEPPAPSDPSDSSQDHPRPPAGPAPPAEPGTSAEAAASAGAGTPAGSGTPDSLTGPRAPGAPRAAPPTMASPRRDGDARRTFPAFPARTPGESGFAETWWGDAWINALEKGALDAARLARGRGYAEKGHVDAITVTPGLVLAYVQGSRPRPYRVQVRLRTLDDADWDRFLDAAAERPGHIAALLDKEMPQSLADCGVPLLPGPGDLEPHCSCPDRGHPCKHAAALCYQTARLLDADPFVLLLLRGRGERELLDALSRLSATRSARAARERAPEPLPGVRASD
ncbi:SWIM zinc finger family protein, partial [Streptomyces carpinensis]